VRGGEALLAQRTVAGKRKNGRDQTEASVRGRRSPRERRPAAGLQDGEKRPFGSSLPVSGGVVERSDHTAGRVVPFSSHEGERALTDGRQQEILRKDLGDLVQTSEPGQARPP